MPRTPAEVFPPSELLRDELDARGWSLATMAEMSGLRVWLIEELLSGHRRFTRLTARAVGKAFGTGPELWLNMQRTAEKGEPDG